MAERVSPKYRPRQSPQGFRATSVHLSVAHRQATRAGVVSFRFSTRKLYRTRVKINNRDQFPSENILCRFGGATCGCTGTMLCKIEAKITQSDRKTLFYSSTVGENLEDTYLPTIARNWPPTWPIDAIAASWLLTTGAGFCQRAG
ncbi:hypothetical protein WN51_07385 [Melipona quadrifasciata]|uniref:Uncharacterized protein n=1 Tax=Melipona quadrifasciata TaxID=166423 RepID=A0A0M8ZRJ7_9HYME|nr:hypothetical protein WN51_07385 [Melipona quadrifasciata]